MFLLTGILLAILLVLIVAYLWYIRSFYEFFSKLGIPGPKPVLFFGNLLDVFKDRRLSLNIQQWTKKYGRIFGYYEGHTPILVISDPDVLQDIFIKSFSKFHSRRLFPLADQNGKQVNLFFATGLRWKRQRFIINPTFSSAKLKQMTPLIHRSIGILMKKMDEEYRNGQAFDIYGYFKRLTMDVIWSCAFGVDTDMQININDPYLKNSQGVFSDNANQQIMVLLALFINELNLFWQTVHVSIDSAKNWIREHFPITQRFINGDSALWIIKQAYKLIEKERAVGHVKRTDLLKLMLESVCDDDYIEV